VEQTIAPEPSRSALRRLALQLGLEFVTLDPARTDEPDFAEVNPLAATMLPEEVVRERRVLPIAYRDGVVTLATPDPFADVTGLTERQVRLVATAASDLDAALAVLYGTPEAGRIGERLVAAGAVSAEQVGLALRVQARAGGRVGELLVHAGAAAERDVAVALAEQAGLPFADAAVVHPDPQAVALIPEPLARRLRVVPILAGREAIDIAAAEVLSEDEVDELAAAARRDVRMLFAAPRALEALSRRVHGAEQAAAARTALLARFPGESAAQVLSGPQRWVLGAVAIALVVGLLLAPGSTAAIALGIAAVAVALITAARLWLGFSMLGRSAAIEISPADLAAADERALPTYTVLVPLLREGAMVPRLLAALAALDYPRHRLDVRLLVETDDAETLAAVRRAELPPHVTLVEVPLGAPRTKPRALAYGLLHARGERLVVFDAEDRPEPDQLRKAAAAFERLPRRVACLQARLATYNGDRSVLTRWFAADYAVQFDLLLPALAARGAPVPLGGTSNHFVTERLHEVGGWDPFNVTEDADLGVRMHKAGLRTAMLDSVTLEEAPVDPGAWVRQRSRWSKGHLQTLLVQTRHPARLVARLGVRGTLGFLATVGSVLVPLAAPAFWLLTTLYFLSTPEWLEEVFSGPVYHVAGVALFAGTIGALLLSVGGVLQRGLFGSVRHALLVPLAWGLVSFAAWRGLAQLPARAHEWEKTEHGAAGSA
jgi:cellulose synthase/poly-beta-1,6-N-acetylglucosamine synthase-like glycosyltransferase